MASRSSIGVPLGLVIGRFWIAEAALGILVTGGYAMPLVALVPLLVLWFGLGFAVKAAVIFLMSVFPICINTWLGVKSVPKTLIDVGKSLRRVRQPSSCAASCCRRRCPTSWPASGSRSAAPWSAW